MSIKKIMVGDVVDGKIVHYLFENGDILCTPSGIPLSIEGHTHSTIELTVTKVRYIDSNRQDSYFPDGSIIKPYKDIKTALDSNSDCVFYISPGIYFTENLMIPKNVFLIGQGKVEIKSEINDMITFTTTPGSNGNYFANIDFKGVFILNSNDTLKNVNCYNVIKNSDSNINIKDSIISTYDVTVATITSNYGLVDISNSFIFSSGCKPAIEVGNGHVTVTDTTIMTNNIGDTIRVSNGRLTVKGLNINYEEKCGIAVNLNSDRYEGYIEHLHTEGKVLFNCSPVYVESIRCNDVYGEHIRYRSSNTIENDSTVYGKTVKNALNTLNNDKMSILFGSDNNKPEVVNNGQQYFNTTLDRPIFYDRNRWVDALGEQVFPIHIDLN